MFSNMNQINKQSVNLQEEKLKELQRLMPQLFDEKGALDIKELELLSKDYPSSITGKYEFNWAGKMLAKRNAYKPSRANLKPDKARSIDFDSTENLIIEGDNLEVLKLLQKSYSNKIKCIYIDPPYNTGNDFVYTDDFSEDKKAYWEKSGTTDNGVKVDSNTESQGRYHSNWLNMMYPRLVLARELLKEDGVIFVSIDDTELFNLKKILDEVFGEENFIGNIVRIAKTTSFRGNYFAPSKDYLCVYSKNVNELSSFTDEVNEEQYKKIETTGERKGELYRDDIAFYLTTLETRPNQRYFIECPDGELVIPPGTTFPPEKPKDGDGVWRWNLETFEKRKSEISFKQTNNSPLINSNGEQAKWNLYTKSYLIDKQENGNIPRDYWTGMLNRHGSSELKKLGIPFLFPKPTSLLKKILKITNTADNDIILDFFAGSGTTAHAVMELNKEDGGNRKYILVQLPELTEENSEAHKAGFKTISDITIERVKRVSEKIQKEDEEKLLKEGRNLDLGFKVFKLAPSFFPENQFTPDPEKTEEENIKALDEYLEKTKSQMKFEFDEEELLFEILLKDGFKLNYTKKLIGEINKNKVYKVMDGEKEALICLDDSIENSTLKILEGMKDMRFICLERAVDTTKKWNLKSIFGQNLWVA